MNTLLNLKIKLVKNNGRAISQIEYASIIGSLMYAVQCTRLDIAFTVSKLSMFTSYSGSRHWKAIERVLGYLKKLKILNDNIQSS